LAKNKGGDNDDESGATNLIDAATRGASSATHIVHNIVALLISCIAFVAFLNSVTSYFFGLVGHDYVTFEWLLGKAFMPLAFVMGIPWEDCEQVGFLIGIKVSRHLLI
jgi:pyrimidine nucleoside transport protein